VRPRGDHFDMMNMPIDFDANTDEILQRALSLYRHERDAIQALESEKSEMLRHLDVPGMNTAVAICFWGRSGSYLLASYLDGHEDIVTLPMIAGEKIYPFFEEYASLSLWEKLIAYPTYSGLKKGVEAAFFEGDFAIASADYYAAIHALFAVFRDCPATWLGARLRFFQFLHAAYALATGVRSRSGRPIMIYAQHWPNDALAQRFVEDFPTARFIHTIRDPISSFDSWYERSLEMQLYSAGRGSDTPSHYLSSAVECVRHLCRWDRAHDGMEARTRAIRFEDLHLAPEMTMRRLVNWLGIPYLPCLIESTWHRIPYVVKVRGVDVCGPNPANAQRRWKNLFFADRLLIFALMHDNFVAWNYPIPTWIRARWIRLGVTVLCLLVPMKMELINARLVLRLQAWPSLRRGRIRFFCGAPIFLLTRRLRMMLLIAAEAYARLTGRRTPLTML
jgi:hypothetical protein